MTSNEKQGLLERLEQGPVICAEGYLFEFERRGYLQAGAFVPEVVLDHPEVVDGAAPRVRPRGLRRRRGVHLLRPPREAADRRQGASARALNRARARAGARRRRRDRRLCSPATSGTRISSPRTTSRGAPCAGCSRSRPAGRSMPASTSSSRETFSYAEEALIALDVDEADGPSRGRHPRTAPGADDSRRPVSGRGVQTARGRRRRRRRAQLHPRSADDAAATGRDPVCRELPRRRPPGSLSHARRAADLPVAARPEFVPGSRSRRRSIRSSATGTSWPSSARPRSRSASAISASAAARGRTTSAASRRPSAARRPASKYTAGHVEARISRHRPEPAPREPGVRREALTRVTRPPPHATRLKPGCQTWSKLLSHQVDPHPTQPGRFATWLPGLVGARTRVTFLPNM